MELSNIRRRTFIKSSLTALAAASLPASPAFGESIRRRPEWHDFKKSASYSSYVNAVRSMRANTDASDRNSWNYWVNSHQSNCPHGISYFLAWHRGFLYYFEQQLRIVSGDSALMLPYWDYYKDANIPAEFTNSSSDNPLYVDRLNTNVYSTLTMGPFSLISFQRGLINSFEASLEVEPHGKIHNLIGGVMASLGTSPTDPIFWLHHAQIDRLWHAWAFADNGRTMPPLSDGYWSGVLTYGPDLILERNRVRDPRTYLGYTYTDETLPSSYPPPPEAALKGGMMRVAMKDEGSQRTSRPALDRIPERPPAVSFRAMEARPTGVNKRAIGGALDMTLGAESLTVNVAIGQDDRRTLQYISKNMQASPLANSESAESYSSVQVVLDNVRLTPAGKLGGYYYDVYLNLPNGGGSSQDKYLLGSFGPFEISTAQHHAMHQGENAARLVFPATQLLRNVPLAQTRELTVSFVRVSGEKSPKGPAVLLGEMRVELSTDEIE